MALAIFLLTYLAIAGQRLPFTHLDRPSGAMAGAVLMVAFGVVTPLEAYRDAINPDTLVLLLGMMILSAYLAEASFFRSASYLTLRLARTPRGLLVGLTLTCAALSAFLVNDTVCLMVTPLVLTLVDDAQLPPLPYLLAVAMGSNVGSVATLTGNPQNMILGQLSHIPYAEFAAALAPVAAACSLLCAVLLLFLFRKEIPTGPFRAPTAPPPLNRLLMWKSGLVLLGVVTAFFAGLNMAWTALAGAAALTLIGARPPRKIFERVDFVLLVFFAGLFIVVHGVSKAGYAAAMLEFTRPLFGSSAPVQAATFSVFSLLASNVFSNVPFVMLAAKWIQGFTDPRLMWLVLALSSTLAGNLTIVGSVANIIVLEGARDRVQVGFGKYFRYGAPITLATLVAGTAMLLGMRRIGWPGL